MTENELTRAAADARQREQDRRAQYLQDQQRRRDLQLQEQRAQRIAAMRSALHTSFGADIERELGGSYAVVGELHLMDGAYDIQVADVTLRIRQMRDDIAEQWVCEVVASGTRASVDAVPDLVEVNRDRLLLALHALYCRCDTSDGTLQRSVGSGA